MRSISLKTFALRAGLAAALLAGAAAAPASALTGLDFRLHNETGEQTGERIVGFFFAPAGSGDWVAVRGHQIAPGAMTTVSVHGSFETCSYDLVAVLSSGRKEVDTNVNLCRKTDIYV